MSSLDEQIAEAEQKLAELKKKKLEEPTTATIHAFVKSSGKIRVKFSKFHAEGIDVLRRIPSRVYLQETQDNIISAVELPAILENLTRLGITYSWRGENLEEEFNKWINQADIVLSLNEKKSEVLVEFGPKMVDQRLYIGDDIQTLSYNYLNKSYSFALAEAYKFPKLIEKYYPNAKVEYEEGLKEKIIEQTDRIKVLMEIANADDCPEIANPFIGLDSSGEKLDLKPHQRVAVKFAQLNDYKALVAYDMGGGKTPIGIASAELGKFKKILVICPAPLKKNWQKEIKRFINQDALILSGSEPEEWQVDAIILGKYKYYIINYDIMSRSEITDIDENNKAESINKWALVLNAAGFDLFIVDESHRIKNMDSKRSKAVRALNMPHVIPLSGTPIVNRPSELFPSLNIINRENFNSFASFANAFMSSDGRPKNVKKLHEILSQYMIRRTWEQIYGKNLDPNRIPFTKELGPQARANYERILQGVYISLRNPNYQRNVTSILAELVRCKQICSADNVETTVDLAIEAAEETQKKVIIFSQFLDSQADIAKSLGKSSEIINGGVPDDKRYEIIEEFQRPDSRLKFLVTNILEGLTMTAAWTTIFNDLWWTPKDHRQAEGRAFGRVNDPHSGNSYYIQNENTIDEFIVALLEKKLATFKEVIDGVPQHQEMEKSIAMELIEHLRKSI